MFIILLRLLHFSEQKSLIFICKCFNSDFSTIFILRIDDWTTCCYFLKYRMTSSTQAFAWMQRTRDEPKKPVVAKRQGFPLFREAAAKEKGKSRGYVVPLRTANTPALLGRHGCYCRIFLVPRIFSRRRRGRLRAAGGQDFNLRLS